MSHIFLKNIKQAPVKTKTAVLHVPTTVGVTDGKIYITFDTDNNTCSIVSSDITITAVTLQEKYTYNDSEYILTSISSNAFSNCTNLSSVTIQKDSKLKTIGYSAFQNTGLTSINIPSSITYINSYAFSYCVNLSYVIISQNSKLETIRAYAFARSGLTSIEIPSSVTSINIGAFYSCTKLSSINIPTDSKLKTIGNNAFADTGLTSIEIPSSVTSINDNAFSFCTKLTSITVNPKNKYFKVDSNILYNFKKTRLIVSAQQTNTLTIPKSIINIDYCVFTSCTRITSIVAIGNKSFTVFNNTLYDNKKTRLIVSAQQTGELSILLTVINIDEGAFNSCRKIVSININSNSNFYLEQGILYNNNNSIIYCPSEIIGSVNVSSSVNYIYLGAFINCTQLTSITVDITKIKFAFNIFPSTLTTLKLIGDFNPSLLNMFIPFNQLKQMYPNLKEKLINIYYNKLNKDSFKLLKSKTQIIPGVKYKLIESNSAKLIENSESNLNPYLVGLTGIGLTSIIYLLNNRKNKINLK